MANVRDRLILLPRFSTLAGAGDFTTQAINVSAYEGADVSVWMGRMVGAGGSATATVQESTDQAVWVTCAGTSEVALSDNSEQTLTPTFARPWMRLKVNLAGTAPVMTCYAVGYLEKRRA